MALGDVHRVFSLSVIVFLGVRGITSAEDNVDDFVFNPGMQQTVKYGEAKAMRYLLYDVNPGEGFNLRRDVYMRVANLVTKLLVVEPWTLVLPPWGRLYHWQSGVEQSSVPWSTFFDLESLRRHVPVLDFEDYIKRSEEISEIYYLQRYEEGWTNGKWEEKADIRPCTEQTGFKQDSADRWRWHFWGYEEVYGADFKCLSIQMQATNLLPFLTKNTTARSVFLPRAEEIIHGEFSEWSTLFWKARRSLVFAKHLRDIADDFRRKELDSTDKADKTILEADWTKMKRDHGDARGGPYLAVHMRRADFLYAHRKDVPTVPGAAAQIRTALKKTKLSTVFVATDCTQEEFAELLSYLTDYAVVRYVPPREVLERYKDGGVAIIDQWICAHARYFMGTSLSTFSFRIHEEREILGFDPKMTFNRFCGDEEKSCDPPTKWLVKY